MVPMWKKFKQPEARLAQTHTSDKREETETCKLLSCIPSSVK